jgi:uncharacterized membrane protein
MPRKIWGYALSHHQPKDYDRCFSITVSGKEHRLCSRCLGWYSSFTIFWSVLPFGIDFLLDHGLLILYLFPIPAVADWSLHRFKIHEGTNLTRFGTGFLLGFTFANLLHILLKNPLDPNFWVVTIAYTTIVTAVFHYTNMSPGRSSGRRSTKVPRTAFLYSL